MANKPDEPLKITEASHLVPCSVKFLRKHVRRGNIKEHRLSTGHLVFYAADIKRAKELLYGVTASSKNNGR